MSIFINIFTYFIIQIYIIMSSIVSPILVNIVSYFMTPFFLVFIGF